MSDAPERVWIDNDDLLKVSQYSHHSDCCICLSIDSDDSQDTEYLRADIAEKAKKDAVREVLETMRHEVKSDVERGIASYSTVFLIEKFINHLLNEVNK